MRFSLVVATLGRHADALALLEQVRRSSESPLRGCAVARVRHLFHDREEFTLVGSLAE